MARMLDLLNSPESRRPRAEPTPAPAIAGDFGDDDSSVPFIEVGAPGAATVSRKPARTLSPTIIPMPRLARRAEPVIDPLPNLFRVAFQPLPFPGVPEGPLEQRVSRELVAFHHPAHAISEQYRGMMTEIESQLVEDGAKALLFASVLPGAGTTSVMLNLALTRSRERSVVVVDAHWRRPAIAERLGIAAAPGLREVLARTVPLAWALHETGQSKLQVLPAGTGDDEPAMDLWPLLLDQLKQRFDWVLIDGGERGESAGWPALAGTATATYLVLRQAELEREELNNALHDAAGDNLRGYVLTSN